MGIVECLTTGDEGGKGESRNTTVLLSLVDNRLGGLQMQDDELVIRGVKWRTIVIRITVIGPAGDVSRGVLEPAYIIVQRDGRQLIDNNLLQPGNRLLLGCGVSGRQILINQRICGRIFPVLPVSPGGCLLRSGVPGIGTL